VHRPEHGCLGLKAIDCVCNSDTTLFLVFSGTIHASTLPLFIPPKLLNIISSALFTRVTHITPSNSTTKMAPMSQHRTPHRPVIALVYRPQLSSSHIARVSHPKTHIRTHHHRSTRNLPFITETFPSSNLYSHPYCIFPSLLM
jgi:hypothetical protein